MKRILTIMVNSSLVLTLSAVMLSVILALQVYEYKNRVTVQVPEPEQSGKSTGAIAVPKFNAIRLPTIGSYNEVLERPLFNPDRKPVENETQDSGVAIQQNELSRKWMLTGVVIANANSTAMLKERNGPRSVKLSVDMKIDGWSLQSVTPFNAVLVSNGREVVLPLYESK